MDKGMLAPGFSTPASRQSGSLDFIVVGEQHADGPLVVQARLLGSRIDTRGVAHDPAVKEAIARAGLTFAFRYGVAVTFGATAQAIDMLDVALARHVLEPVDMRETETASLEFHQGDEDRIGADGQILLADATHERLLLAATVLARSVVLSRNEILVSEAFGRSIPLIWDLRKNGRARLRITDVMKLVGNVLAARHRVMGTVQVGERPDLLWDHPDLDRLYARLEAEYELRERAEVLERKFAALGDYTSALLNIVQDKRAFRLEAAVIAMIGFEILLTLSEMFIG